LFYLSYNNINFFKQRSDAFISNINQALSYKNYNTSIGLRIALLTIGYKVFMEKPIFGHGIYDNIKERVRVASLPQNKEFSILSTWAPKAHYHNNYMEILTQLGLVGLLMFLYIFYFLEPIPNFFQLKFFGHPSFLTIHFLFKFEVFN